VTFADFGAAAGDGNTYARVEGNNETVTVGPEIVAEISALVGAPPAAAPAITPAN
jgi:hypothetical protein